MLQKNVCLSEAAAAGEASNIIIAAVLHILDAQGSSDATANVPFFKVKYLLISFLGPIKTSFFFLPFFL